MSPYRRKIDELETRYQLEKDLRDLYVEGPNDKLVLEWYCKKLPRNNVQIYEIGTVDVPLQCAGQRSGNAGRLVALANSLEQRIGPIQGIRCLTDRDFGGILYQLPTSSLILMTDFASLDSYAIDGNTLGKFFSVYWGSVVSQDAIVAIFCALKKLFFTRAAKATLAPNTRWILSLPKCLTWNDGLCALDIAKFMERLVAGSCGSLELRPLANLASALETRNQIDHRYLVHRDDLVLLLSWYGKKLGVSRQLITEIAIMKGLIACLEFSELRQYPMFQKLEAWIL